MHNTRQIVTCVVSLLLGATALAACGAAEGDEGDATPVVQVEDSGVPGIGRVTLSELGTERIGLELADVEAGADGAEIPYAAVLYDPDGETWTFVNTEPNVYVRQAIVVDHIEGDTAYLTDGPDAGTKVVATGANELYGAEIGVGDE